MNKPKVTIIIPVYNAEGMKNIFKQCLNSALNLKYDNYEVVVVNSGSTDKTREILEDYEKDLKVINLKKDFGAAGARNIAYEKSKSEFVLLLDSDVIAEQDSLKEMVKISISDNKIGALGGIQVDYKKRNITGLGGLCDIYGNWFVPKEKLNVNEVKESYYSYIPTAFLLVKRKVIGNTLHPKEFLMYIEDVELCFRIWSRGFHVKLYPIVVCSHEFRTSTKIASKRNKFLNRMLSHPYAKNSALLLSVDRKFLPNIYILKLLGLILYLPIVETIHFPRYLLHKSNYNFAGAYYPSLSMTYLKYSIKELSTINDYGNYIPLSIKLKGSKKLLFNPSKIIFGPLIRVDYEKTIINKEDINRSTRKFIVVK